ncbi:prolipoprotein diacylglyceryl transferase [Candidatus Marinimicrobia bacterium]|nr:prolipoprotein diacylglyceryl transferase [Candidatus Neomarinimicrobiota bacterium]
MDPVLISIGPLTIYWYSTMYLVAFGVVYILCSKKIKQNKFNKINLEQFEDLLSWCFIGLLIGARFGYVIFYNFEYYLSNPLEILLPFKYYNGNWVFTGIAGMSYHGGVIGVVTAIWLFSRKVKLHLLELADFLTAAIPLGYFFGRIGNFINGELYGRTTEASIGMYFPNAGDNVLRHPSQLYEALFEGIILYYLINSFNKHNKLGFNSGTYVFGYGIVRFFIEYFREPDAHLGFILFDLSMGQLLCIAMMLSGIYIWYVGNQETAKAQT